MMQRVEIDIPNIIAKLQCPPNRAFLFLCYQACGNAIPLAAGFVGQAEAREAAILVENSFSLWNIPRTWEQGSILSKLKGTKQLKLDPTIYDALIKEKVAGIEASGAVKRVGRSDAFVTEFDLEAEEYVPIPKGEVHKKKKIVQDVTLHDLDAVNARPQGGQDIVSNGSDDEA
ncbi:hypothetical protein V6N12_062540 [Hibiscus sabdariffa]|uniref:RuvB-like helicase n=1 Tax=Hibiscus sabdariffa TaxID=183260 RepID=A0ABR2F968_9ROSI